MKVEFFCSPEDEKIFAIIGGSYSEVKKEDAVITHLHQEISAKYPDTIERLNELYPKDRYAQVGRFIRCNFSLHDRVLDIDDELFNLEYVFCPFRPYCEDNGIICNPVFSNKLRVREIEISKLIARGLSAKEIASKLFISVRTLEKHRSNIYKALKIHSNNELVTYMYTFKLI